MAVVADDIPYAVGKSGLSSVRDNALTAVLQFVFLTVDSHRGPRNPTNISADGGTEVLTLGVIVHDIVISQDDILHASVPVGFHQRHKARAVIGYASLDALTIGENIKSRRFPVNNSVEP